MLAEAGKVLKALSTAHVKSLQKATTHHNPEDIAECHPQGDGWDDCQHLVGGLLDSGASNPLRQAADGEIESATKVRVTLAGEDTRVLSQKPTGYHYRPEGEGRVRAAHRTARGVSDGAGLCSTLDQDLAEADTSKAWASQSTTSQQLP